jgi:hypothetical protein
MRPETERVHITLILPPGSHETHATAGSSSAAGLRQLQAFAARVLSLATSPLTTRKVLLGHTTVGLGRSSVTRQC